jgi:hypothetical protein
MQDIGSSSGKPERNRLSHQLGLYGGACVGIGILLWRMPPVNWLIELLLQFAFWWGCFRIALLSLNSLDDFISRYLLVLLVTTNFAFYLFSILAYAPNWLMSYLCIALIAVLYIFSVLAFRKIFSNKT